MVSCVYFLTHHVNINKKFGTLSYRILYDYFMLCMQRLILLGILLCVLGSAHRELPPTLLSQEKMVSILTDLEVAKAMIRHCTTDENTSHELLHKNALLICQAHDIDPAILHEGYKYYFHHLESMQEIYKAVVQRLDDWVGNT
mmetsp:Transcript_4364/g.9894  ORF Transcript_4364/g.9894 Transcript_4364/m.9894 type:complete len:143 (-) Transcript_4364:5458-5886(-)